MRILILSANTGGGHNSCARAIAEQLDRRSVEYEIADTLALISEKVSSFISWGHSYVYRKLPGLFGVGYRFEEKHPPRFIYEQCARGADGLQQKLVEGGFDAVICVHVFSGMMMTEVRARFGVSIPTYFVATDYTCSPGVSELKLDGYFIPHRMLLGEFVRNGISADRLFATGIPIGEQFYREEDKVAARRALGLPEEGRVVLLSCGSMGCGHLEREALRLFSRLPQDTSLVVLCGTNQKVYDELTAQKSARLVVLSFTDRVADYMSAADLYITKPGGLTTSEAIAMRLPMIFINAVPGCETRNFEFLTHMGVACGARRWGHVSTLLHRALRSPAIPKAQIEQMRQFTTQNAAAQIALHVLDPK